MPLDPKHLVLSAIEEADALMTYFRTRALIPAEASLVIGAMNAALLITAQAEGKPNATVDEYTSCFRASMELFLDVHDMTEDKKPK